jgi:hypothetical protein
LVQARWSFGVNPMQRFLAWLLASVRWLAVGVFSVFVIPLAVEFVKHLAENVGLYDRPQETANVVLKFLLDLAEQTWLRVTALALGCFVVGLWSGWFLRGSDGSRAEKRKELGTEMIFLAHQIADIRHPMHLARPRIRSCFATTKKLGLWVPDDRVFQLPVPVAYQEVSNYLRQVGRMLKDGNFREAKQDAKKSKAAFEAAFARWR